MQVTSTSYRAYALDLWGFGDTAHNTLNYSLEQQANLLDRFLNEMGIGKIALVGHGLGALVGMSFATRFPQSVDRMMAISCPPRLPGGERPSADGDASGTDRLAFQPHTGSHHSPVRRYEDRREGNYRFSGRLAGE